MTGYFSRHLAGGVLMLAAILVASCDNGDPTGPRIVTLRLVSGNEQSAPVGTALGSPLIVRAVDQNGTVVPGVPIVWAVTVGDGSILAASTSTDEAGIGQAIFRVGTNVGPQRVTAQLGSQPVVEFRLDAVAAPASLLAVVSGNNQRGVVATALSAPLKVVVTDAVGNSKSGIPINFSIASGGGTLSATVVISDSLGEALSSWSLGTIVGTQSVVVTSPGLPAATFTAVADPGAPASLVILGGNNQSASPGVTLPTALQVRVVDQFGNGVPSVVISFTPAPGDGVTSPASATTSAQGIATTSWTLGPAGGSKKTTASGGGFSVEFNAGSTIQYAVVSAGGRHACAVSTDNVLYCWGFNGDGQLGIGVGSGGSGPVFSVPQPSAATGDLTFRESVSAAHHGCAVSLANVGYCWGVNIDGRLGNNTLVSSNSPAAIAAPLSWRSITTGQTHSCGITLADRLYCWGFAEDGQTGTGVPIGSTALTPQEVVGAMRYRGVAAGRIHTCAVTMANEAYCWGVNQNGQVGDGSTTDRMVPTLVSGGHIFVTVASGAAHSCALDNSGSAWCWGANDHGQLGDGSTDGKLVPVAVAGGLVFESLTAGEAHTCGIVAGGAAYCWGDNTHGQLGIGSMTQRLSPTPVAGGLAFATISAGDGSTCAVTPGRTAYCWGDNEFGQLGDGTNIERLTPAKIAFQP